MPRATINLCVVLAFATMAIAALAAGSKNIFDDDWTPPKASETHKPIVVKPPTPAPADPVKPADPTVNPPKEPAPVTPAARRPVPGKPEQAAVRKVLKEVFAAQLVDRTAAGRLKLTQALLAQAEKSADAPVDEFVLLAAAIDAGTEAANLPLAFDAADRMGKAFDVDTSAVKVDTTTKLGSKQSSAEAAAANVKAGLELTDRLIAADDYAAAARVCAALLPIAGGNAELRAQVVKRQREVTAARDAAERVARDVEKLKGSPEDPAANLAVGKYLCFAKGNWKDGLPLLSRGNDPTLKALVAKETAGAETPEARVALGDAWWDIAQASAGPTQPAIQAHAVTWYKMAAPDLKGLAKAKVDKRVAQAVDGEFALKRAKPDPADPPGVKPFGGTRILDKFDFTRAQVKDGLVVLTKDESVQSTTLYTPPVSFRIVAQTDSTNIRIYYGAAIIFNWEANPTRLRFFSDGTYKGEKNNEGVFVPKNTWVAIDIVAKPTGVEFFLDDKLVGEITGDYSTIKQPLRIATHEATIKVKSVQVKEGQ